ncbi:MAG: hypothetical protein QNJ54_20170 [Prochloraceae cyanobacterium]|nr:hypothetical protein [Prochloraceae cyanobacterium]
MPTSCPVAFMLRVVVSTASGFTTFMPRQRIIPCLAIPDTSPQLDASRHRRAILP